MAGGVTWAVSEDVLAIWARVSLRLWQGGEREGARGVGRGVVRACGAGDCLCLALGFVYGARPLRVAGGPGPGLALGERGCGGGVVFGAPDDGGYGGGGGIICVGCGLYVGCGFRVGCGL